MNKSHKTSIISTATGTALGTGIGYMISKSKAKLLAKELGIKPGSKEYKDLLKGKVTKGMIAGGIGGGLTGLGTGMLINNWNKPMKSQNSNSPVASTSTSTSRKSTSKESTKSKDSTSDYPMSGDYDFKDVLEAKKKAKKDFEKRHPEMRGEVEVTKLPLSKEDQTKYLAAIKAIYDDKSLSQSDKIKLLKKIQIETEKARPVIISEKIYKNKKGENKSQDRLRIDARNARIKNHIERQVGRKQEQYINAKYDDDQIVTSDEVLKRLEIACKKHKERTGEWPTLDQKAEYFNKINKRYWSQPNQIATPEQRQDFRKWQKSRAHTKGDLPNWDSYSKMKGINPNKPIRKVNMYSNSSADLIQYTKNFTI